MLWEINPENELMFTKHGHTFFWGHLTYQPSIVSTLSTIIKIGAKVKAILCIFTPPFTFSKLSTGRKKNVFSRSELVAPGQI